MDTQEEPGKVRLNSNANLDVEDDLEDDLVEDDLREANLEDFFTQAQKFQVEGRSSANRHVHVTSRSVLMMLIILLLVGWLIWSNRGPHGGQGAQASPEQQPSVNNSAANDALGSIMVDVHGDVVHPGVYQLPANSRVQDAIQAAGGFQHATDSQLVNAAAPLDDGQEVFVPSPGSVKDASGVSQAPKQSVTSSSGSTSAGSPIPSSQGYNRLDLNTADELSLETLPGIGPSRAAAIVNYRNQHGGFKDPEELQNIPGIGPKTWEKIQPFVTVGVLPDGQKP